MASPAQAPESRLQLGRIINDKYQVLHLLGRGGMGAVYAVQNLHTDGMFAIKVLGREVARDPQIYERFCAEARITSALRHPGIVQVLELDVTLPGKTGFQLCWEIKSRHEVPVVLLSGKCMDVDHKLGLAMGADAYVTKPFNRDHLLRTVAGLCPARR
jgi:CheY-like chemotaxis protein